MVPEIKDTKTWEEAARWLAKHGYGMTQIEEQKAEWAKANKPAQMPAAKPAVKTSPKTETTTVTKTETAPVKKVTTPKAE